MIWTLRNCGCPENRNARRRRISCGPPPQRACSTLGRTTKTIDDVSAEQVHIMYRPLLKPSSSTAQDRPLFGENPASNACTSLSSPHDQEICMLLSPMHLDWLAVSYDSVWQRSTVNILGSLLQCCALSSLLQCCALSSSTACQAKVLCHASRLRTGSPTATEHGERIQMVVGHTDAIVPPFL
ncbi:hypothetical protein BC835DRAFT_671760 [Cytidiella melzeri]|nr:hypothetical protein BC835DRAFT_671760 [Cytidiella melzeri]